jgi:hypothetical protein
MQAFDNGSLYTVTVTRYEVEDFRRRWPCSGLCFAPVTFQFEKSSGDLVDSNYEQNHPNVAGAALVVLSQDAQKYGAERLKLTPESLLPPKAKRILASDDDTALKISKLQTVALRCFPSSPVQNAVRAAYQALQGVA